MLDEGCTHNDGRTHADDDTAVCGEIDGICMRLRRFLRGIHPTLPLLPVAFPMFIAEPCLNLAHHFGA